VAERAMLEATLRGFEALRPQACPIPTTGRDRRNGPSQRIRTNSRPNPTGHQRGNPLANSRVLVVC